MNTLHQAEPQESASQQKPKAAVATSLVTSPAPQEKL
jgi:hypothetical protein